MERIKNLSFPDGNVLIENIFLSDDALTVPITNPKEWTGLNDPAQLRTPWAQEMFEMSSFVPESYLSIMREYGYNQLSPQAKMMFPGNSPDIVELGIVMSSATPVLASWICAGEHDWRRLA